MSIASLVDTFRNLTGLGEPQGNRGQFSYAQREVEKIRKTFGETIQNWVDRAHDDPYNTPLLRTMLFVSDDTMTQISGLKPFRPAGMEFRTMQDVNYPRYEPVTADPVATLQTAFNTQSREIEQQLKKQDEYAAGIADKIAELRKTGRALGMMLAVQDANGQLGKFGRTIDFARYMDDVVGFAIRDHEKAAHEVEQNKEEHPSWPVSTLTASANMHFSGLYEYDMQRCKRDWNGKLFNPDLAGYELGGIFVKNDGTIRSAANVESYKRKAKRENPLAMGDQLLPPPLIRKGYEGHDLGYD